jgi:hypothetical protein
MRRIPGDNAGILFDLRFVIVLSFSRPSLIDPQTSPRTVPRELGGPPRVTVELVGVPRLAMNGPHERSDMAQSEKGRAMASPNPPYFVHFLADPASSATIDHAQGAPGGVAHRAGHTSIHFRGRGGLTWQPETGRPRTDGQVPFYFRSVNVYFRLTDYVVRITSDYAAGSCTYNATLRHEVNEHIVNPTRIMYGFRDQVVAALNAVLLPTQNAPRWLRPNQVDTVEAEYIRQVGRIVQNYRTRVSNALRQAQAASDSPANYQTVYRQCPIEEWNRP